MLNYECKVETKSPIRRQLTISIKPDSIQKYIEKQLNTLQKTVKMNGFRAGKVPLSLVRKHYLQDVKNDVFSKMVRDSYVQALEENKIVAVGMPEIEAKSGADLNEGEELTFTASVEIFPEIEIQDLSKIKIKRQSAEVTDEDVEKSVKSLLENHAELIGSEGYEGPAKTGDFLDLSFKGTVGGEALDVLKGDNRLVEIGSKQFMEDFENGLIGMKKGETKTFPLSFAKDFSDPKLAGKTAEFTVTVHEFKKKQIPQFDDDFAKRFKLETSLELRKKIAETLKEDRETKSRETLKEELLRSLCEKHKFEVPAGLTSSQLEYLMKENAEYLKRQGFTEKMIREYFEKNLAEMQKRAEDQVRASLVLDKIAEQQQIKVNKEDLDHEYSKISSRINLKPEQVKQMYSQDENAVRQLRFRIKEERTIEYVLGQVKIADV